MAPPQTLIFDSEDPDLPEFRSVLPEEDTDLDDDISEDGLDLPSIYKGRNFSWKSSYGTDFRDAFHKRSSAANRRLRRRQSSGPLSPFTARQINPYGSASHSVVGSMARHGLSSGQQFRLDVDSSVPSRQSSVGDSVSGPSEPMPVSSHNDGITSAVDVGPLGPNAPAFSMAFREREVRPQDTAVNGPAADKKLQSPDVIAPTTLCDERTDSNRDKLSDHPPDWELQNYLFRNYRARRHRRRYSYASGFNNYAKRTPGWEPGIDINTTKVTLDSVGSTVTIVDYSANRYRLTTTEVYPVMNNVPVAEVNHDFIHALSHRPEWANVRWINVNGLSWEAIEPIAHRYHLHKLALEDMVDIPQRTKVDKYPNHVFCCFPLHKLMDIEPEPSRRKRAWDWVSWLFGFNKNEGFESNNVDRDINKTAHDAAPVARRTVTKASGFQTSSFETQHYNEEEQSLWEEIRSRPMRSIYQWHSPSSLGTSNDQYSSALGTNSAENEILRHARARDHLYYLRPLTSLNKIVGVEQVSMFLTADSTVISFFESRGQDIERPILQRLSSKSITILRESSDPAILFQAILDAVVDLCGKVIGAYRLRMNALELEAILKPSMIHTRDLHMIYSEMTLMRNGIVPITSLISSLREGCRASEFHDMSDSAPPCASPNSGASVAPDGFVKQGYQSPRLVFQPAESLHGAPRGPRISEAAGIYLADVADHTLSYTEDLDIMRNYAKSTIDLIFNTISIQSSDSVKILSLVTVIFLPLTFLTGYFGMNFRTFTALRHDVTYYWVVSIPFTVLLTLAVSWDWFRNQGAKLGHLWRTKRQQLAIRRLRARRAAAKKKKPTQARRPSRLV